MSVGVRSIPCVLCSCLVLMTDMHACQHAWHVCKACAAAGDVFFKMVGACRLICLLPAARAAAACCSTRQQMPHASRQHAVTETQPHWLESCDTATDSTAQACMHKPAALVLSCCVSIRPGLTDRDSLLQVDLVCWVCVLVVAGC